MRAGGGTTPAAALGPGRRTRRRLGLGVLEVGLVPARALELEAGRGQRLGVARLAALRAIGERGVGHFLQMVLGETTGRAAVFVDRHDGTPEKARIITESPVPSGA